MMIGGFKLHGQRGGPKESLVVEGWSSGLVDQWQHNNVRAGEIFVARVPAQLPSLGILVIWHTITLGDQIYQLH